MGHYLDFELKKYTAGEVYPFHMPGHKRQVQDDWRPEELDITEISGFDDLHHADGILAEAQERMARVFGLGDGTEPGISGSPCLESADSVTAGLPSGGPRFSSYFLVNGSTAGILAAISAAAKSGETVLAARNCHKAVYHGIYLRQLRAEYVWPMETGEGIQGSIDPAEVEAWFSGTAAESGEKASAVIITSPTYDGVVSDIAAIAEIAHRHGAALIVDEAHGAHFGFSKGFPQKAIALGADYVIESLHKTLPAFTQSAVIHAAESAYADRERLEFFLQLYQTSSPSYLLMAGMDRCSRILAEQGEELFAAYEKRLDHFYWETAGLQNICILPCGPAKGIFDRDPSKILIRVQNAASVYEGKIIADPGRSRAEDGSKEAAPCSGRNIAGAELFAVLRDRFGLELEMAAGRWATALTSIMDTDEGFERLLHAVRTLDAEFCRGAKAAASGDIGSEVSGRRSGMVSAENGFEASAEPAVEKNAAANGKADLESGSDDPAADIYQKTEAAMTIFEAAEAAHTWVPLPEAAGRISGGFVYLYPPGIPILAPGERIPERVCALLQEQRPGQCEVYGIREGKICCTF